MNDLTTHSGDDLAPIEREFRDDEGNEYDYLGEIRPPRLGEYIVGCAGPPNAFRVHWNFTTPAPILTPRRPK
jgi:hypothetical protein